MAVRHDLPVVSSASRRLIRLGRPEDAEALQAVHEAAVSAVPARFYPPEIVSAWKNSISSLRMSSYMADPGLLFLVARHNGAAVGFGCLEGRHIRAVYVHPGHGRQGFGQALLQALEKAARKSGFECVFLRASLNAAPFYLRNGYTDLGPGEFDLCVDLSMPCRRMAKAV
ncbi:MAG: GNAT family N-acetyltransferase [Desulfocurvibacter africanus]